MPSDQSRTSQADENGNFVELATVVTVTDANGSTPGGEDAIVGAAVAVTGRVVGVEVKAEDFMPEIDDPDAKGLVDKFVAVYVGWFVLLRLVDFYYIFTADGRFPEGLQSLYPSDEDRLQTVRFMHWLLMISICGQTVTFVAVMALLRTKAIALLDAGLRPFLAALDDKCCRCCHTPCDNFCSNCPCRPKWGRFSRGALFLAVWSFAFAALQAPFQLWAYKLTADYSIANTLTNPVSSQVATVLQGFIFKIFNDYIYYFVLLLIVGAGRHVFLIAWTLFMAMLLFVSYNPEMLAQGMGGLAFPKNDFGVAHGFPVVEGLLRSGPTPLNRIFWPEHTTSGRQFYQTHDRSRGGTLKLADRGGIWRIFRDQGSATPGQVATPRQEFAQTNGRNVSGSASQTGYGPIPENMTELPWQTRQGGALSDAPDAHMSVRHGKDIRDRLMNFSRAHDIAISEIYMIDQSSTNSGQNAFAAGLGDSKVIALFDTLFLGDNTSHMEPSGLDPLGPLEPPSLREQIQEHEGQVPMLSLLAQAEGVDTSEEPQQPVVPSHSGSRAMTDGEIVGILGHELGHSAMGHNFRGVFVNAATTAASLGTVSFCVWSPKITAGLGAHPNSMLHVGFLFYTHVAGSLLSGFMGLVTNAITRSQEYAADAYSAEVSEQYATDLQTGLAKLTVNSNIDPDEPWLYEFIHRDHPTLVHRWNAIQAIKDSRYETSNGLNLKASADDEVIVTV